MTEAGTAAGRLLTLLSLLQARREWPGPELQDRLAQATLHGRRFQARAIPGAASSPEGDPAAFVRRGISALRNRYEATVTYEAAAERIRARLPGGWGTIEALDAHRCVYRTSDDDLDWLALRIGMAGADFAVEGPPELLAAMDAIGRRLLAAGAAVRPLRPG